MASPERTHLPECPIDPERYDRLYAFNRNLDDQLTQPPDWKENRIKAGLPEADVYRLLPSDPHFEFGGYLTGSRIRYFKGGASRAGMLMAKACTFHSHPTKNPHLADIPSLQDVHSFLFYRHLRSVTVGATKIWVFDKTKPTLVTVRNMASWMEANHLRVVTRLMKQDFGTWQGKYVQTVMHHLGWTWPATLDEMDAEWPKILRTVLKIKVGTISRDPGMKPR